MSTHTDAAEAALNTTTASEAPTEDASAAVEVAESQTTAQSPPDPSDSSEEGELTARGRRRWRVKMTPERHALLTGLPVLVALIGLTGWLGLKDHGWQVISEQRAEFLQAGRQGALNLTTIDWHHADADVQRIVSSTTGTFHDDFANRSQPLIEMFKQTQSTTVGTVTSAGLQDVSGDQARVLIAVDVNMSDAAAPQQDPRSWRMRISVQKVAAGGVKVSNVEFVP